MILPFSYFAFCSSIAMILHKGNFPLHNFPLYTLQLYPPLAMSWKLIKMIKKISAKFNKSKKEKLIRQTSPDCGLKFLSDQKLFHPLFIEINFRFNRIDVVPCKNKISIAKLFPLLQKRKVITSRRRRNHPLKWSNL